MYVLVKTDSPWVGAYVAPPGSKCSYTRRLEDAQVFSSVDNARRNACENERPTSISDLLGQGAAR